MSTSDPGWGVVLPVKRLSAAKSRLSTRPSEQRRALALAFALDVVTACRATAHVGALVVVSGDDAVRDGATRLGADVVADPEQGGLLAALLAGAAALRASRPDLALALLAADLPALRPGARHRPRQRRGPRSRVRVRRRRNRVHAAHGDGGCVTRSAVRARVPERAHAASGAVELTDARLVRLRCDVDTEVDLWHARMLGVGPHTAVPRSSSTGSLRS